MCCPTKPATALATVRTVAQSLVEEYQRVDAFPIKQPGLIREIARGFVEMI